MSDLLPRKALVAACTLGLLVTGNVAQAVTCGTLLADPNNLNALCMEDGNAAFLVDPTYGVSELNVDGASHVWYQDFFYDDLTNGSDFKGMYDDGTNGYPTYSTGYVGSSTSGSTLSLYYEPVVGTRNNQLGSNLPWIQIDFTLTGGAGGSDAATIVETFTITNQRNVAMDVSLFAFTDIDLGGQGNEARNDQGMLLDDTLTRYKQFDANFEMLATTDIPVDGYMIGQGGEVLSLFDPGMPDLALGTGDPGPWLDLDCGAFEDLFCETPGADLQMVAQWNRSLAANGGTFSYQHTLSLSPVSTGEVPVPAALPLALSGLALLGMAGRRKRKIAASS